jgi:hypothetical protein
VAFPLCFAANVDSIGVVVRKYTQQRCVRMAGNTFVTADQKSNAPSPTATFGSTASPRDFTSSKSSVHDSSLSR